MFEFLIAIILILGLVICLCRINSGRNENFYGITGNARMSLPTDKYYHLYPTTDLYQQRVGEIGPQSQFIGLNRPILNPSLKKIHCSL